MRTIHILAILVLLAVAVPAAPAHAGGVVTVCDEAHLRAALAGGGTVTFACSGTITLTHTITIAADTTIDGSGQDVTISGNDAVRVLTVNPGITLNLNRISLSHGYADGAAGGIYVDWGTLTITNSTLSDNRASHGGAFYSRGGTATVTITNSTLSDNRASLGGAFYSRGGTATVIDSTIANNSAYRGGGIYNYQSTVTVIGSVFSSNSGSDHGGGIYNAVGPVSVNDSTFTSNSASRGGGIYNFAEQQLTVSNSTLAANSAGYGGGIYNDGGRLSVNDSLFSSNNASSGGGGGIATTDYDVDTGGVLSVTRSIFVENQAYGGGGIAFSDTLSRGTVVESSFIGNTATQCGGGMVMVGGGVVIYNSTFSDNSAVQGGGLCNHAGSHVDRCGLYDNSATSGGGIYSEGTLYLANSTLSGNSAQAGGALFQGSYGTVTVSNSTLSDNSAASQGGGIYHTDSPHTATTLKNSVVAANPLGDNCFGAITDGSGNLSFPDTTCPGINADPLLGPLQNNGGPTWTMALGEGSAALDAADDAICAAPPVNNLDQRGVTRPQGLHCDIGAVEQIQEPSAVSVSALRAESLPGTITPAMIAGLLLLVLVAVGVHWRPRPMG